MVRARLTANLAVTPIALALVLAACGSDRAADPPVKAINLKTGQTQNFENSRSVPGGWGICSSDTCSVPPSIPCQNLSQATCQLSPNCRLKEIACSTLGCAGQPTPPEPSGTPGGSGGGLPTDPDDDGIPGGTPGDDTPGDDGIPGDCTPEPARCETICVPKSPLSCDELSNKADCGQRSDCQWLLAPCPGAPCAPGMPCPPCDSGSCRQKRPPSCQALDANSCHGREDCQWTPAVCSACPSTPPPEDVPAPPPADHANGPDGQGGGSQPGSSGGSKPGSAGGGSAGGDESPSDPAPTEPPVPCPCRPFCQPKPSPNLCPPVSPPVPCAEGKTVANYDARGCAVGWSCERQCPNVSTAQPQCSGTLVPKYDSESCLVEYECVDNRDTCGALARSYTERVDKAKVCNPMLPVAHPPMCSIKVRSALGCMGCPTFVNDRIAVDELAQIEKRWLAAKCGFDLVCPAVACQLPKAAGCQSDSNSGASVGSCSDTY